MVHGATDVVTGVNYADYSGLYVMSMPGGPALRSPRLGGGNNSQQLALVDGGYNTRSEFGGTGPTPVAQLGSGEVYVTPLSYSPGQSFEFSAAPASDLAIASGGTFTAPDYTTSRVVFAGASQLAYLVSPRLVAAADNPAGKYLVGTTVAIGSTVTNVNTDNAVDLYAYIPNGNADGKFDVTQVTSPALVPSPSAIVAEGQTLAKIVHGDVLQRGDLKVSIASNDAFAPTQLVTVGKGVAPIGFNITLNGLVPAVRLGEQHDIGLLIPNLGDGNQSGLGEVSNLRGKLVAADPGSGFVYGDTPFSVADSTNQTISIRLASSQRGVINQTFALAYLNGSTNGLNNAFDRTRSLQYTVAGPEFGAHIADPTGSATMDERTTIRFGNLQSDTAAAALLTLLNESTDTSTTTDISALVQLFVQAAHITGPNASLFSMTGLNDLLLDQGGMFDLGLSFLGASAPGAYHATLTIDTDQLAEFAGGSGQSFAFNLQASVGPVLAGDYNNDQIVNAADYTA